MKATPASKKMDLFFHIRQDKCSKIMCKSSNKLSKMYAPLGEHHKISLHFGINTYANERYHIVESRTSTKRKYEEKMLFLQCSNDMGKTSGHTRMIENLKIVSMRSKILFGNNSLNFIDENPIMYGVPYISSLFSLVHKKKPDAN